MSDIIEDVRALFENFEMQLQPGNIQKPTYETDAVPFVQSNTEDFCSSAEQSDNLRMQADTQNPGQNASKNIENLKLSYEAMRNLVMVFGNLLGELQSGGGEEKQKGIQPKSAEKPGYANKKDSNIYDCDAKTYYDTSGKTGLLILLNQQEENRKGHKSDTKLLHEFFRDTLKFDVRDAYDKKDFTFTKENIDKFIDESKRKIEDKSKDYYCIVCFVGSHGNERGICTEAENEIHTVENIREKFSNKVFSAMAGRPKIFLIQTCRGLEIEGNLGTDSLDDKKPDKFTANHDADCIVMFSTTHGKKSVRHSELGSILIQKCMSTFHECWMTDHLEEMLITVRTKISSWSETEKDQKYRQTAEVCSTLTKRLKFAKPEKL